MPGGDRTGPAGMGPMTGRQAGNCVGNNVPGGASGGGFGRRGGMGRGGGGGGGGGGRGQRNMYNATGMTGWQRAAEANAQVEPPATPPAAAKDGSSQQEIEILKAQLANTEGVMHDMKQRLDSLEAEKVVEKTQE